MEGMQHSNKNLLDPSGRHKKQNANRQRKTDHQTDRALNAVRLPAIVVYDAALNMH